MTSLLFIMAPYYKVLPNSITHRRGIEPRSPAREPRIVVLNFLNFSHSFSMVVLITSDVIYFIRGILVALFPPSAEVRR